MADVPFTTNDCGKHTGVLTAVGEPFAPLDRLEVNGSPDLSTCIVGPSGACVYSIEMTYQPQWAPYGMITIDAQGPAGFFSGSLALWFFNTGEVTPAELESGTVPHGEVWNTSISSSTRKQHTLPVNSNQNGMVLIKWHHDRWYQF